MWTVLDRTICFVKRNIMAYVSYDGTDFHGWQAQEGIRTVQGVIESALQRIFKKHINVQGAGRTDKGVHARKQVITFYIPPSSIDVEGIKHAMNANLPEDIYVWQTMEVDESINARFSAYKRIYHYYIWQDEDIDLFKRKYVWWFPHPLDIEVIRRSAIYLEGEHDFSSFRPMKDDKKTVRTLDRIRIILYPHCLLMRFEARSYLRSMVRTLVGTLVNVGRGIWEPERLKWIVDARDRSQAGPTAPPNGLFLYDVLYPKRPKNAD
ncbi:MAG: tRNA pseudouridine(38-40) synthase TruA [Thermotoga sp.]|nr:tRNA pseudouridine(38-40) synthase TruA [Thermotogota bacterium]RKX55220.1 MAG: tRNA pseudouridine(38-40) synthase TruA [Thermotoga sp.]